MKRPRQPKYAPVGAITWSGYWSQMSVVIAHDGEWVRERTIWPELGHERKHLTPFDWRRDAVCGYAAPLAEHVMAPAHEHDCDPEHGCTYLATFTLPDVPLMRGYVVTRTYDAWWHGGDQGSCIARYDSEGSEYLSMSRSLLDPRHHPALVIVASLADMHVGR